MGRRKKPAPITVGSRVRVRAIRGPREEDGAWYWSARAYNPETQRRVVVSSCGRGGQTEPALSGR